MIAWPYRVATRREVQMNLLRVACAALAACTVIISATPAKADWHGRHWRHYEGRWWGPGYYYYRPPPAVYRPPVVVYAPPPVYYAPPPVYYTPGVTFGFAFR